MTQSLSLNHHQQTVNSPVKSTHSSQREDDEEDWFSTAEGSDDLDTTPKTNGTTANATNAVASSSNPHIHDPKGKGKQVDIGVVSSSSQYDADPSSDSPPPSPIPHTTITPENVIQENGSSGSIRTNSVLGLQLRAGPSRSPASNSTRPPPLQESPRGSANRNASYSINRDQNPSSSSMHASDISIPSVNIIPTSPPPPGRSTPPRMSSNSLDIPSSPTSQSFPSDSQTPNRRRETLGSTTPSDRERRSNRRRSLDPRAGSKRLSGFISNLFHNREREREASTSSTPNPDTLPNQQPSAPRRSNSPTVESPLIEAPITPPPALPPPTLQQLGLKLSSLTSHLQQSQFTHAPSSGTFLAPHYLLLCHSQGLDVLPLEGPPAPYPYALIRRVAFKSVLVMEERGVLVAIAGRREGVRVYALEEVRKAVEWRMEVELIREREKQEGNSSNQAGGRTKKAASLSVLGRASESSTSHIADRINSESPVPPIPSAKADILPHVNGEATDPYSTPRTPLRTITRRQSLPTSPPPLYASLLPPSPSRPEAEELQVEDVPSSVAVTSTPRLGTRASTNSLLSIPSPSRAGASTVRQRNASIATVSPTAAARLAEDEKGKGREDDGQMEFKPGHDDSDEEALVAAGPSGSAALDERTSSIRPQPEDDEQEQEELRARPVEGRVGDVGATSGNVVSAAPQADADPTQDSDITSINSPGVSDAVNMAEFGARPPTAAPAPTLLSIRQALLSVVPPTISGGARPGRLNLAPRPPRAIREPVGGEESGINTPMEDGEFISFDQMLRESRIPPPPPVPPLPPILTQSTSSAPGSPTNSNTPGGRKKKRRRWSVMNGVLKTTNPSVSSSSAAHHHHHHHHENQSTTELNRSTTRDGGTHPTDSSASIAASGNGGHGAETISMSDRSSFTHGHGTGGGPSSIVSSPTATTHPLRGPTPSASTTSLGRASGSAITARSNGLPARSNSHTTIHTVDRVFAPHEPPVSPIRPDATPPHPLSAPASRTSHRFLPKLFTALGRHGNNNRRSASSGPRRRNKNESDGAAVASNAPVNGANTESEKENASGDGSNGPTAGPSTAPAPTTITAVQSMAPKLEYVKLPGTKGALAIKAVETAKKSFLAILCERRAARRRAREARGQAEVTTNAGEGEGNTAASDIHHPETIVTTVVSVGDDTVDPSAGRGDGQLRRSASRPRRSVAGFISSAGANGSSVLNGVIDRGRDIAAPDGSRSSSPTPANNAAVAPVTTSTATAYVPPPEELAAIAAVAQFGPYTTFQQLSFAPNFPLGTIADDYIIPPTYDEFMAYRRRHEPTATGVSELIDAPEAPAILGPPAPPAPPLPSTAPKWYYVDPKGVLQGPWKTSLMQSWYKDGFLPPDLPVRREHESTFILLKELVVRAEDSERPFHTPLVTPSASTSNLPNTIQPSLLLKPLSLLAQPRHFGPPALFFSSRGGHSTTIVDSRGKSVLRGRLNWSADDDAHGGKLGDVRRLEAFDSNGRAVIVALRQCGLEAVDVGDALLQPADESRAALPSYQPNPIGVSRRPTFVWRLGNSIEPLAQLSPVESPFTSSQPSTRRFMSQLSGKRSGTGASGHHSSRPSTKGTGDANGADDADGNPDEEIIFLGRHDDKIYICEKTLSTFRILTLSTVS
ncbi:hypothetical protein FRC02_009975 [Tulasnella sp. 418]|nr:hypothetical protein FRC02_009975 [Tulasnella sp. 418]